MAIPAEGAAGLVAEILALEGSQAWVIGTVQVGGGVVVWSPLQCTADWCGAVMLGFCSFIQSSPFPRPAPARLESWKTPRLWKSRVPRHQRLVPSSTVHCVCSPALALCSGAP